MKYLKFDFFGFMAVLVLNGVPATGFAAGKKVPAQIEGDRFFGAQIKKISMTLKNQKCILETKGEVPSNGESPNKFQIIFSCDGKDQILWDIANPFKDDFSFDDPKFELNWAGDQDHDGRIDLEMELSPKYSCSRTVLFLSSKAKSPNLVGLQGDPKKICGE